jgi:hypothetical protein
MNHGMGARMAKNRQNDLCAALQSGTERGVAL